MKIEAKPVNLRLRDALREWRRGLAKELGMPAYIILHDATLDGICRRAPKSIPELCEIPGIGEKKAERFGAAILKVVAQA